jgi:hypothetical protein
MLEHICLNLGTLGHFFPPKNPLYKLPSVLSPGKKKKKNKAAVKLQLNRVFIKVRKTQHTTTQSLLSDITLPKFFEHLR